MKEFDPFVSKYLLDQGLQKTTAKMLEQFQDKLPSFWIFSRNMDVVLFEK